MKLTITKPKPSMGCLIGSFIAGDLTNAKKRIKRFVSREHVQYVARHDYGMPDSAHCTRALALVKAYSPDYLLNHCLRSYAFGVAMAHKIDQGFDKEVLFLGSIMHDLGLTETFDGPATFEVEGAKVARKFCIENGIEVSKADLIHEMIALHDSVGVAHKREPEVALLHFGAGVDVAGLWLDDVNARTMEEVIAEYPRLGFSKGMARLIKDQVERKPDSYIATMVRLGFLKKIEKAPFTD
jgi:hypothetical protein